MMASPNDSYSLKIQELNEGLSAIRKSLQHGHLRTRTEESGYNFFFFFLHRCALEVHVVSMLLQSSLPARHSAV